MATDPKEKANAMQKRVRSKAIDGLNASRMRPSRATYFMICVGNTSCRAYLAPAVGNTHKTMLRGLMGADTGLKYHRGQCLFEAGFYTFVGPTLSLGIRALLAHGGTYTADHRPALANEGPPRARRGGPERSCRAAGEQLRH